MAEQNLQHAERNAGSVAGDFVAGQVGRVEGQTALRGPDTLEAGAGQGTAVVLGVVRGVEVGAWVLLETLDAVPGHVLDGEESSVGLDRLISIEIFEQWNEFTYGQDHVQITGSDEDVVGVLNDVLENTIVGRALGGIGSGLASIISVSKDVDWSALVPGAVNRGVEGDLDIGAVEVNLGTWWLIVTRVNYAELREWMRAGLGDMVEIEARVDFEHGAEEVIKLVAGGIWRSIWIRKNWEWSGRWGELQIFV